MNHFCRKLPTGGLAGVETGSVYASCFAQEPAGNKKAIHGEWLWTGCREKVAAVGSGLSGKGACGPGWLSRRLWGLRFRMGAPAVVHDGRFWVPDAGSCGPVWVSRQIRGGFGSSGRGGRAGSSLSGRARTLLIPPLNVETVCAECFPVGRDAFSAERRGAYRPKNLATRSVTAMPIRRRPMMLSPWWPCPELCSHSWNSG